LIRVRAPTKRSNKFIYWWYYCLRIVDGTIVC